ncbi:MAG: hypothetical protein HY049_08635 [Acidobacteria bacterium]|nr:hypothetical protein [Acidobacteriota bacterium]
MKRRAFTLLFVALLPVLAAGLALHTLGWLALSRVEGSDFAIIFGFFFAGACAATAFPERRLAILLAMTLGQIVALHGALTAAGAVAIWVLFVAVVRWRASNWLRLPAILAVASAPACVVPFGYSGDLIQIVLLSHAIPGLVLRGVLIAYESTRKSRQLEGMGFLESLLYVAVGPLSALSMIPIGWTALRRGFRLELDPVLIRKGTRQIALGFAYLLVRNIAVEHGWFPDEADIYAARRDLNAVTALAACHLVLLRLFLDVTGNVHLVIGMLRVLGFDLAPGSDRPYLAKNILEFWRRWNTYYREFLTTLAYYPIVMSLKARPFLAIAIGGQATFLLMGFAHVFRELVWRPQRASLRGTLGDMSASIAYGIVVTAWMLKEAWSARRRRAAGLAPALPRRMSFARTLVAAAVTTSALAVIMVMFTRPAGYARSASVELLAAFLRAPHR